MAALVAGGFAQQQQRRIAAEVRTQAREARPGTVAAAVGAGIALDPGIEDVAGLVGADAATVPESLQGFVIGVPKEYFPADLDPGVRRACDRALRLLRELGAAVREVSLPHTAYAVPTYYIIAPAEASSNLARYDGARYGPRFNGSTDVQALYRHTRGEGFGAEVQRRILVGTYVLSSGYYDAYYRKAQQMRALIAQDFRNAFDRGVDLLFTPTTPTPAFKAGEKTADPVAMYLSDVYTVTANLAGLPALSLPVGRIKGLPIGGQFIGQAFLEDEMLEAAYALERVVPAGEEV